MEDEKQLILSGNSEERLESGRDKLGVRLSGDKLLVVVCILLCELCERLTYYSVVANLVLYCTSTLKLPSSDASSVSLIFSGTFCCF